MPLFSYQAQLYECWPELKDAIALSSPAFFDIIKDIDRPDPTEMDVRTFSTIWKYFNRSKYRATPYGTFAGFGIVPLLHNPSAEVIIAGGIRQYHFADWPLKDSIDTSFTLLRRQDDLLFANSTHYLVGDQIRFVTKDGQGFQLAEIDSTVLISQVLSFVRTPQRISAILHEFAPQVDRAEVLSILEYLFSNQLLISSAQPNIIGQDYFGRMGIGPAKDRYVISERQWLSGSIQPALLRHVPALIEKLRTLVAPSENRMLRDFTTRFQRKFEQRWVPLMVALDPELGVGYGELENDATDDEFISALLHQSTGPSPTDKLKGVLVRAVLAGKQQSESLDIESLPGVNDNPQSTVPNSLYLLGEVQKGKVRIEQLGGCTANALLGRFTLASDDITKICKDQAGIEKEANPEVLFFDVGYTAEGYVDNINRRKSIYDLQLNLLAYDTSPEPLTLNDIYICINAGTLILKSKRLNRRLVPRIASAYNFQRSDLSVFRLLCDLQHHGLQTNLRFDLKEWLPDLAYYPEVSYRNLVLSAQAWRLQYKSEFSDLKILKKYIQTIGVSPRVRAGSGDQTLIYDLSSAYEVSILQRYLQKVKSMIVEEYTIPDEPLFKDTMGNGYHHEVLVVLNHHQTIYRAVRGFEINISTGREIILPGSEWLYFEVFCHSSRSNALLTGQVGELLRRFDKLIMSWFFIRYSENGDHIRLRLKLHDPGYAQMITQKFAELLQEATLAGIVSDLTIRTYKREVQRYGALLIGAVEDHFNIDSELVMKILETDLSFMDRYKLCITLIEEVCESSLFSEEQFGFTLQKIGKAFETERGFNAGHFKVLNERYRVFQKVQFMNANPAIAEKFVAMAGSLISTLKKCPESRRGMLFSDLMHMHINRLFASSQRMHEAVIYYFFSRHLLKSKSIRQNEIA